MSYKTSMLLVNDNQDLLTNYKTFFDKHDYKVFCTTDSKDVLEVIAKKNIEIVLICFQESPSINTPLTKLLIEIKDFDQRVEVILIAPEFHSEFAVEAVKLGATDCISPSNDLNNTLVALNNVSEYRSLR